MKRAVGPTIRRMGDSPSLPLLMPTVPNQRWSCHSCGHCCRALVGHLFDADRERIEQQNWADELGVAPYVRLGRGWALNKKVDGACVFLDGSGLCTIHAKYGEAAKPLACRLFPFSLRRSRHGWQVSLRFDCPSVTSSHGTPIGQYRPWLGDLAKQLGTCEKASDKEEVIELQRGVVATIEEIDEVIKRFTRWIKNDDVPLLQRLTGAARITTTLQAARLRKVRGRRFLELLDLLFGASSSELTVKPAASTAEAVPRAVEAAPPTARQRGMVRQLAFAHAEHVSLAELRSGLLCRGRKRWQQLRRGRRFLAGEGAVPRLPGFNRDIAFETVESVEVSQEETKDVNDLMVRYLCARLQGRSVFGAGYYGWPVFSGLSALWLSVAAVGWLARYRAAVHERTTATLDDIAGALGMVDRAATRLPALGTLAERARVTYLLNEDGVARLICRYAC